MAIRILPSIGAQQIRTILDEWPVTRPQSGASAMELPTPFSVRGYQRRVLPGDELGPRSGTTQEAGRRSGVGGVQLWRAKHSDQLGRSSKSKDHYGLELLAMCVVA